MDHVLERTQDLPVPIESVFEFFSDASNLQRITPPELHFQILTPLPMALGPGALIEYKLRLGGVPFRWTTRIVTWQPPVEFSDEQLRGPYALWVHTHQFEATETGTQMLDRVRYRLPLWPIGELGHSVVRKQLERIFRYRGEAVREALAGRI
jgi:ligand-binding SRPBCC domain-containing protein